MTVSITDDSEILDLCGIYPNSSSSSSSSSSTTNASAIVYQFATVNEIGVLKIYDTSSATLKK